MEKLSKMKLSAAIFWMVLCCCQRASQAYDNPFVIKPQAENVLDLEQSAFVQDMSETKRKFDNLASSSFVENLPANGEKEEVNLLEQLISTHKEKKRLHIESLMKRGNILDPGTIEGSGSGPTCYSCYGTSLEKCLSSKKEKYEQCNDAERCFTVQLVTRATGQPSIAKGCISTAICQSDMCETIHNNSKGEFSFCKASCCKGRLCNGEKGRGNGGMTQTPSRTPASAKPSINGPKCFSCQGTDLVSCSSRMTLKQCLPEYQCADAYLVTKSDNRTLVAKGCMPSKLCRSGLCKQLNSTGRYSQCRSSCCASDQCNAIPTLLTTQGVSTGSPSTTENPSGGPTQETSSPTFTQTTSKANTTRLPTQRPLPSMKPTPQSGYLCYACNSQTSQECYSSIKVHKCDIGKVCFTGRATRSNGLTMFAKGCIRAEQCATSCKRLSLTTKDCKVDCCNGDYCNKFSLTTERPTSPQSGCFSILLQVLEVFKKLLETIDTLIKANALNKAAPLYKHEINSLMGKMNTHAFHVTRRGGPAVKQAITRMRSLRRRAGKVMKKLDQIIEKR